MTRLTVGVIGHVDHGKTALVRALTGADTDRLPEEKRRGISIALGFAHLTLEPDGFIDLIDMPGHERFVRTMISGATGIDAVLLVIAANEGIKPQTIEHVDIAALLGLRRAVVAVAKTDLVSADHARQAGDEAVRLLARRGVVAAEPIMTSALSGAGIDALRRALSGLAALQQPADADGVAFLPIDRAFSIAGHGPVVTGTLRGASVSSGDTLELHPSRRPVRVRAVQVHGERVAAASPGQRVALNLRDVDIGELERGMALAAPDALALSDWLTIAVRSVEGAPPLKNGMRLRALFGTEEQGARLRLLDRDVLEPGQSGFAQLHLSSQAAIPAREPLVLRLASPARTVAGGQVLEAGTQRLRRHRVEILDRLADLSTLPPAGVIAAEVERVSSAGTTVGRLSQLSALSRAKTTQVLQTLPAVVTRSGVVVRRGDMEALMEAIPALLEPQPLGLTSEALLARRPGTGPAVLEAAIGRLVARGLIVRRGGLVMIPRPDEDRARAKDDEELADHFSEVLRRSGLMPPDPKEILTDPRSRRAVDRLLRTGVLIRAVDRAKGREILFHRDAILDAQGRLAPLIEQGPGLLVSEIGAVLGISRKYSMPLVDHLDTIHFTRRIDDRRVSGGTTG